VELLSDINTVTVYINGKKEDAPVSEEISKRFREKLKGVGVAVHHDLEIPVGAGFGASGAAALSLSLCFSEFLPLTRYQCAKIAHEVEVETKTGLGDVVSQLRGGIEIRVSEGLYGIVDNILLDKKLKVLSFSMGEIKTDNILKDDKKMEEIKKEGEKGLRGLLAQPTPENMITLSKRFSERIGIHDEDIKEVVKALDGVSLSSMVMLGKSVFSFIREDDMQEALSIIESFSGAIFISDIQEGGAW